MFCNYCGAPNSDVASFCNKCGKAIVRPPASLSAQEGAASNATPPTTAPQRAAAESAAVAVARLTSPDKYQTFTGHTHSILSLAFSPDGRWMASGSMDKTAKLWDVTSGREVRTFTGNLRFTCVEFSPDGRRLVLAATSALDGAKSVRSAITLWDSATPNEVRNLAGHEGPLFFVKFSPDGSLLASTDGSKTVNLWDVASGQIIKQFRHNWIRAKLFGGGTEGSSLAFTPDGRFLASRCWPVVLWDVSSGKEARTFRGELSGTVAWFLGFTPDGRTLVEAETSGKVTIWDVASGKEARSLVDPPERKGVSSGLDCAALNADGSLLAVASYACGEEPTKRITLWDMAAGRTAGTVTGIDYCGALAFSPDGQWLAVGDMEYGGETAGGKIRLLRTTEIR